MQTHNGVEKDQERHLNRKRQACTAPLRARVFLTLHLTMSRDAFRGVRERDIRRIGNCGSAFGLLVAPPNVPGPAPILLGGRLLKINFSGTPSPPSTRHSR